MKEIRKIAFLHRTDVRLVLLFSILLFLGMGVGLLIAQKVIKKDFHRFMAQQIDSAGVMAENAFRQVGQTGFLFIDQISRDFALNHAVDNLDTAAIKTAMDRLATDSNTDSMILLTPQGEILYHSEDPNQVGQSRIQQHLIKLAVLEGKTDISIYQEMNNFLIYSSGLIRQTGRDGEIKAIVLAGYAVSDQIIHLISENSKIGITMIRRRAIIASTFNRDGLLLQNIPMQWAEYQMLLAQKDPRSIITFNNKRYFAAANRLVLMDPTQEGSILYTLPTETLELIHTRLSREFIIIFSLVFIAGSLLCCFFAHHLLIPLHKLLKFTSSEGHHSDATLLVDRKDEVGVLAECFCGLIGDIKEQNLTLVERVKERTVDLVKAKEELQNQANRDYLTNLYNRRYFNEVAQDLFNVAKREEKHFPVIMLDIDKFKRINDTHGHGVGDKVIKSLSSLLVKHVRNSDIVSRFGGEEFALLLPFTDKKGASVIAEKLRAAVEKQNIHINDSIIKYTISLGIDYIDIEKDKHISEALDRADAALYRAKESGRNRVVSNYENNHIVG